MLDIFQYDFIVRAFAAGIVTGVIAPVIGMFLVVRRYALLADTLAHVSLVGVAVGFFAGVSPALAALGAAVLAALGIERLRQTQRLFGESVLALFLSGGLAIAVVLISAARGRNVNLLHFLFGSITTVTRADLSLIFGVGALVLAAVALFYKELFFVALNEELAEANGLATRRFNNVLIILAALTVGVALQVIGVLLIGALMVIPVATALQYRCGFLRTLLLAVAFSLASVIIGLLVSYRLDLATGATIVVVALIFFSLSLLINQRRSLNSRLKRVGPIEV